VDFKTQNESVRQWCNCAFTTYALCASEQTNTDTISNDMARNVTFEEDQSEQHLVRRESEVPRAVYAHDEHISNFFSRPIKLYDVDWSPSLAITFLHVWNGWMTNKRIANRLCNYYGFKGSLKVKIVTNGNPFYFGRLQASYYPLYGFNPMAFQDVTFGSEPFGNAVIESQRQMINICPTISSGVEMVLPFAYPGDYIPLTGSNDSADLGDLGYKLGRITLSEVSALRTLSATTSGAPLKISMRVYAWMDDIELFGTTSTKPVGMVPQSNNAATEQGMAQRGAVSSALTAIGGAAHEMSNIPALAPYAKPTEVAARLGARTAQLLGFSRPVNVTQPSKMLPTPMSTITHVVGADDVVKLTLDPEQITTIDNSQIGGEVDEMSFKSICGRYSLFNSKPWYVTDAANTLIFAAPVTPHVNPKFTNVNGTRYYPTAVGGLANLFTYWKGSVKYRFDVISTNFHRGRILVVYDPSGVDVEPEEAVQYAAIVDISEHKSFEVEIKYNSHYGLKPIISGASNEGDINEIALTPISSANGVIALYVATELEIPNYDSAVTPSSIDVLCYVKGGDDLTFGYPSPQNVDEGTPHSRMLFVEEADTQLLGCCDLDTERVLTVGFKKDDGRDLVFLGENIDSLRTLCKRYCLYGGFTCNSVSAAEHFQFSHGSYPAIWGPTPNTSVTETIGDNGIGMTFLHYTQLAFVAKRGSVRWRMVPLVGTLLGTGTIGTLTVKRIPITTTTNILYSRTTATSTGNSWLAGRYNINAGGHLVVPAMNPVISWEMPYQNKEKFIGGRSNDGASNKPVGCDRDVFTLCGTARTFPQTFILYCAAGEDFDCKYFVGWPPYAYSAAA